nr:glycoside hydrolase domain-containing protein [Streptomyces sp. SID8379]
MHPELECSLGDWDARLLGNHRILVLVDTPAQAVRVILPWRRQDERPERVDLIVIARATGERVRNVVRLCDEQYCGDIIFEPTAGAGEYYFYYLPYALIGGRNYPDAFYLPWRPLESPEWRFASGVDDPASWDSFPRATATTYQAISKHDTFAPMGFPATDRELKELHLKHQGKRFVLFPESRFRPIEMVRHIPALWLNRTPSRLSGVIRRGEFFCFQVGVHALTDVAVEVDTAGMPFPTRSLMTEGVRADGSSFQGKTILVREGEVAALWFVTPIPLNCSLGVHEGSLLIGGETVQVTLTSTENAIVADGGVRELDSMARLGWLDSSIAHDCSLIAPYEAVRFDSDKRAMSILGRRVDIGDDGFPAQISSHFSSDITTLTDHPKSILSRPISFNIGREVVAHGEPHVEAKGPAEVFWRQEFSADGCILQVEATLEADGHLAYNCELSAIQSTLSLPDVRLTIPIHPDASRFLMGLGVQGGTCPDTLDWSWDVANKNQDSVWIGDVNAGLQISLRDEDYQRPLNSNWYRSQPLRAPKSWSNGGRGGVRVVKGRTETTVEAYSGPIELSVDGPLRFDFRLLITPFKMISPQRQITERYFHAPNRVEEISGYGTRPVPINHPGSPESVREYGATVVNVHHATAVMPYINDPMLSAKALADYVRSAHDVGLRVKIYNTVRELPSESPEVHALRALDGEVYARGPAVGPRGINVGHIWLQEHLPTSVVPGYVSSNVEDRPIVTSGASRWLNLYVEMIDWLARECQIDGVYLDEVGFDRNTMKRVRKVLSRHREQPLIDLHSASQFHEADGFASSANLYMEHLPYVDRLWFSEYVDYDEIGPVQWLIELSGVPFGVLGEMLEGGGNPWKGLVFGATARAPRVDPRPMWRFWDEIGLSEAEMIGWWSATPPVTTGRSDVLATSWVGDGYTVVALASWAPTDVEVKLDIDYSALGLENPHLERPEIEGFQNFAEMCANEKINVPYNRGRVVVIREKQEGAI